jgi:putative ABC transport system permease protein
MLFSRLILRPMRANRLRTVLTALGVTLGVAVMLAIQMANQGSLRGFSAALDAVSGKAALEITCPPVGIDETLIPGLAWLREIGIATPVIEADVTAEVLGQGSETLRVIGIDALRDPALREYALTGSAASGMELMSFLAKPDSLMVTHGFAKRHGLVTGRKLILRIGDRRSEVTVAAVIGDPSSSKSGIQQSAMASQSLGVMDIANAQVTLDRLGRVDRLDLRLHDGVTLEKAEALLKQRLPVSLTLQRPQRRSAAVEKMLAAFHFNLTMLSGIALVVGLFLIYNTISVAVMSRRREIGMLRTLGVTQKQVLKLFLGEALVLGLAGAFLGVPLAKGLAELAISLTSTTVDTLYVATAAKVPPLTLWHWLAGFGIAVPLSLVAAALPALEAARVCPVEAVRDGGPSLENSQKVPSIGFSTDWLAGGHAGASDGSAAVGLWISFLCDSGGYLCGADDVALDCQRHASAVGLGVWDRGAIGSGTDSGIDSALVDLCSGSCRGSSANGGHRCDGWQLQADSSLLGRSDHGRGSVCKARHTTTQSESADLFCGYVGCFAGSSGSVSL